METFVDVVVKNKSTVEITCEVVQIGDWINVLKQKDFNIDSITERHIGSGKYAWDISAHRGWSMDERWEGIEVG